MKTLSIAIIIASALIAFGLHSLGEGIAKMNQTKDSVVEHRIVFDGESSFPDSLDIDFTVKGTNGPPIIVKTD